MFLPLSTGACSLWLLCVFVKLLSTGIYLNSKDLQAAPSRISEGTSHIEAVKLYRHTSDTPVQVKFDVKGGHVLTGAFQ